MSKRNNGFSKIEKIVIVLVGVSLLVVFLKFGSVCSGSFEGSSDAVCVKIIK